MYQLASTWDVMRKVGTEKLFPDAGTVHLRGWNTDSFVSADVRDTLLSAGPKSLSVHDICLGMCNTHRDVYMKKSPYSPFSPKQLEKLANRQWQDKAGEVLEQSLRAASTFELVKPSRLGKRLSRLPLELGNGEDAASATIQRLLRSDGQSNHSVPGHPDYHGRPDWFYRMTCLNLACEMTTACTRLHLKNGAVSPSDIELFPDAFYPNRTEIGVSKAQPDFVSENLNMIGEVKAGTSLHFSYILSVTGYALAYENCHAATNPKLDWGAIYFMPTEICHGSPEQPIVSASMYYFPITDTLRQCFIQLRDSVVTILSNPSPPRVLARRLRERCSACKYGTACGSDAMR